nr:interleukin-22 receptor subunit alpha-1 [Oryctolagus cuniculus]
MRTLLTILTVGSLAAHLAEQRSDLLQHVKFQSSNFENILTWDSGPESTPDTVYSVEYKTYGEREWLAKAGCQRITRRSCNLTVETGNLTEHYYARVTAVGAGGWTDTKMTRRFSSLQHTAIKPADVTCIPKVRSIQVVIHPAPTPIHAGDGHQLTLEDIFHDLFYRVELRVNHTYQMHLGGKQREYEFFGLTPDTEFLGSITIFVPTWSKESNPYVCRVKTLPDRTWVYSFLGAIVFLMGFLMAVFCCLSYRYVTKPPAPPNSLNVQRVLTFQPLHSIQERVLVPVFDLGGPSSPGSLVQPVQYSQIKGLGPQEPPGAAQLHSPPGMVYVEQSDSSVLRPSDATPPQTRSTRLPCAPKATPEVPPPSYTPQVTPKAKPPTYAPQAIPKAQPSSYAPQAAADSWLPSYGVCVADSGKDLPPAALAGPQHLWPRSQIPEEAPAGSSIPEGLSLQEVTSLISSAVEDPREDSPFHPPLGVCKDRERDLGVLHSEGPGIPGFLRNDLPLLSSVQIEGHPAPLLLNTPSPPCSPSEHGPSLWGLLDSVVCPKDDSVGSEAEAKGSAPRAPGLEPPTELDSLFRGLALTVQWES